MRSQYCLVAKVRTLDHSVTCQTSAPPELTVSQQIPRKHISLQRGALKNMFHYHCPFPPKLSEHQGKLLFCLHCLRPRPLLDPSKTLTTSPNARGTDAECNVPCITCEQCKMISIIESNWAVQTVLRHLSVESESSLRQGKNRC